MHVGKFIKASSMQAVLIVSILLCLYCPHEHAPNMQIRLLEKANSMSRGAYERELSAMRRRAAARAEHSRPAPAHQTMPEEASCPALHKHIHKQYRNFHLFCHRHFTLDGLPIGVMLAYRQLHTLSPVLW